MSDCRETHEYRRAHKTRIRSVPTSSPFGDLGGTWRTLDGHSTGSGTAEHRCRVARRHSTSKTDLFRTPDSATIDYAKAFGTRQLTTAGQRTVPRSNNADIIMPVPSEYSCLSPFINPCAYSYTLRATHHPSNFSTCRQRHKSAVFSSS